jgi:hypothetical protein
MKFFKITNVILLGLVGSGRVSRFSDCEIFDSWITAFNRFRLTIQSARDCSGLFRKFLVMFHFLIHLLPLRRMGATGFFGESPTVIS